MTQHDAELPFEFLVGEFRDRLDPGDADDIDDAVYHAQLHLGGFQHLGDAGGAGHVRSAMMAPHRLRHRARLVLHDIDADDADRSEASRVGKEWVSTCRYRGSPYP